MNQAFTCVLCEIRWLDAKHLERTQFACMQQELVGPLVLAFSQEDPGAAAARIIKNFAKENEKLKVKALQKTLENQLLPPEGLNTLA